MQPSPRKIKREGPNDSVEVEWSDGHTSLYPYAYLREHCPCAMCAEKPRHPKPAEKLVLPMLGQRPLHPTRVELVGRYAVQFFWNDGHSGGIYSFDYLRGLCPCEACRAEAALRRAEALRLEPEKET